MTTKRITILLTLYKPKIEEIEYWIDVYKSLKVNGFHFHWLIDNPNFDMDLISNSIDAKDIFLNDVNSGKLNLVYNHIKFGFVNTDYFKTVDPDDFISIENFIDIESDLSSEPKIHKFLLARIYDRKLLQVNSVQSLLDQIHKGHGWYFGTPYTILPTKYIQIDTYYNPSGIINQAEDLLLATICFANNSTFTKIDKYFYLYVQDEGLSSESYRSKNKLKYFSEVVESALIWAKIVHASKIIPSMNWPFNLIEEQNFIDEVNVINNVDLSKGYSQLSREIEKIKTWSSKFN